MAKVKRERTDFEDKAYKAFAAMPIEKWVPFIEKEVAQLNGDDKEKTLRAYKLIARRSLNIENMATYIQNNHNTVEEKKAFKEATKGTKYLKKDKKIVYDANGKPIPEIGENGKPITIQSVVYAVEYFIDKYIPEIKIPKETGKKAFDMLKDW